MVFDEIAKDQAGCVFNWMIVVSISLIFNSRIELPPSVLIALLSTYNLENNFKSP